MGNTIILQPLLPKKQRCKWAGSCNRVAIGEFMETIDRRTFAGAIAPGVVMKLPALAGQKFEEKKMVWGMREPGGFGDYFPDGGYVGRSDKCLKYLLQKGPPDVVE
ncbi:MAG: hypothetical protein GY761_08025, partial [Hyphomicrobiales bacterium]|nr:hypothetical protein [Hyphomicrobiales bacterium]